MRGVRTQEEHLPNCADVVSNWAADDISSLGKRMNLRKPQLKLADDESSVGSENSESD